MIHNAEVVQGLVDFVLDNLRDFIELHEEMY